jgi:hypothetical protein
MRDFSQSLADKSVIKVAEVRGPKHQICVKSLSYCFDVVGKECDPYMRVNVPVTNVPMCVSRNSRTAKLAVSGSGCEQRTSRSIMLSAAQDG